MSELYQINPEIREAKSVVVFGTGLHARLTYEDLLSNNIQVDFFADRGIDTENRFWLGKPVIKEDELAYMKDCIIVIASSSWKAIENRLREKGIEKIYVDVWRYISEYRDIPEDYFCGDWKYLYILNSDLNNKENYIYGEDCNSEIIAKTLLEMKFPINGFVAVHPKKKECLGKEVMDIQSFVNMTKGNLLLFHDWMRTYNEIERIHESRVYVKNTFWKKANVTCEICGNENTFFKEAQFVPFLKERIFQNKDIPTKLIYCPECDIYYSHYRPNEEEMGRLYSGYRDEDYQMQRQRHEPEYTAEFNRSLFAPFDGGASRRNPIADVIKDYVDCSACRNVLDFGGDKGQFIPDIFVNANRYVYEISGTDVIEGVHLITDPRELKTIKWDMIFCNAVLEHLSDIKSYFQELASYMSEGTYLYCEVPIERHVEYEGKIYIHEHINFFRERTFRYLAEINNLEVISIGIIGDLRVLLKK